MEGAVPPPDSGVGSRQDSSAAHERAIVGKLGQNTPDQRPSQSAKTSRTTSSSVPDIGSIKLWGFFGRGGTRTAQQLFSNDFMHLFTIRIEEVKMVPP